MGGGEEFAVVLYGCDEKMAENVANRLLEEVRMMRIPYQNQEVGITVSGGISAYNGKLNLQNLNQEELEKILTEKAEELKSKADRALFYTKENGKNAITPFSNVPQDYVSKPKGRG